jgi:outer membrane lipoprotein carrier protein
MVPHHPRNENSMTTRRHDAEADARRAPVGRGPGWPSSIHQLAALTLLAALTSGALAATPAPATPAAEVEKYLSGLASWTADFEQTIDDGHGNVMRSAAGRLYLQRPGKFRWDYSQPSEQLVLADGKQIWFYDKDLAQANVRDMDTSLASTPASLLSGNGSISAQFDIKALPPSAGLQWFQLVPKHADTDFQLVRIGFDKGELRSMFLADKLNQITQLTFSNSKRNASLAPNLFSFTPPPGVDVIGRGK